MSGFDVDVKAERGGPRRDPFRLDAVFATGGGITVLFGPSGAGKSTLLLALLGAIAPVRGRITVARRTLFDSASRINVPPRDRRIGVVFQDALLFPHLDARGNAAFGLRGSGRTREADRWLAKVGAGALAKARPEDLSGGERQRVALARALAPRPAAVLLDEPFSALDARSREALGETIVAMQAETGIPFLHVTHDLPEAMRLGSTLVVLDRGRVAQQGAPSEVVAAPASATAARAVGTENLFNGTVAGTDVGAGCTRVDLGGVLVESGMLDLPAGSRITLGLRAEDVLVAVEPVRGTSARNVIAGRIVERILRGSAVELRVATPVVFRVVVTPAAVSDLGLEPGRSVHLLVKANAFHRLG